MTTKITRSKLTELRPPADIVANTKARRAWVEAKVAEINAQPNREAKSIGTGSYQCVAVYETKEVECRIQMRGTCQVCGGEQVVDNDGKGRIVLHGYDRPGDGFIRGQCPGRGELPAEVSIVVTSEWIVSCERNAAAAKAANEAAGCTYEERGGTYLAITYPEHLRPILYRNERFLDDAGKALYAEWKVLDDRDNFRRSNANHAAFLRAEVLPRSGKALVERKV